MPKKQFCLLMNNHTEEFLFNNIQSIRLNLNKVKLL